MNAAFVQTRRSRRKLIRLLQQQQEVDSKAAFLLKERFLEGHRKLLLCIGEKLTEYGSSLRINANQSFSCDISEEDRRLFSEICSDFPLEEWEALRVKENQLGIRRLWTANLLSSAQKAYDDVAPFGFLSKLGSSDSEKAEIDRRKATRDSLKSQADSIANEMILNTAEIRDKAERFLRNATSPDSISRLIRDSSIKDQVYGLLADTAAELSSSWKEVSEKQSNSLSESQTHLDLLIGTYQEHHVESQAMLCLRDGGQNAH